MNRGQLPATRCRPRPGTGPERLSGRNTICRNTPSHITYPTRSQPRSRTEVSLGVRGHPFLQRAHSPPDHNRRQPARRQTLDHPIGTSKRVLLQLPCLASRQRAASHPRARATPRARAQSCGVWDHQHQLRRGRRAAAMRGCSDCGCHQVRQVASGLPPRGCAVSLRSSATA